MPTDRAPHPRRMRDLESLLSTARELGLRAILTLFAQSIGDWPLRTVVSSLSSQVPTKFADIEPMFWMPKVSRPVW